MPLLFLALASFFTISSAVLTTDGGQAAVLLDAQAATATAAAAATATASQALRKRGIGWGLNATQIHTLQGLTWWYNWGLSTSNSSAAATAATGMQFVPMQWGSWEMGSLRSRVLPGSHVLLGFNEPNHAGQASLTPQQAAVRRQ